MPEAAFAISFPSVKPQHIRLFVKPSCPWCHKAEDWLKKHGIAYERVDVIADRKALAEMERLSGQSSAPTLDVNGKILADFGPEELAPFWKGLK